MAYTPLTLPELLDDAHRVYHDPAWQLLRNKDAALQQLFQGKQKVAIPPQLIGRVRDVHTGIAAEKVYRAQSIITDSRGLRLEIGKQGRSAKAEKMREQTRNWCSGFWVRASGPSLDQLLKLDLIIHSRAVVRTQLFAAAWAALLGKSDKPALNLDDVHTVAEVADRLEEFMEAAAGVEDDDEQREQVRRAALPIQLEHVPVQSFYWEDDAYSPQLGPRRTWEFRTYTVARVLEDFVDGEGKPLAAELARKVDYRQLKPSDTVTVVIHSNRSCMYVFLADMVLDTSDQSRNYQQNNSTDELLAVTEHGLGRVPYTVFLGRLTTSEEPARRFFGLLDPGFEQFCLIDDMATQLASTANFVAWPQLYVKKHQDAGSAGTGDRPADFPIEEGIVIDGTGPGESLETVPWTQPEGFRLLADSYNQMMQNVDRLTFGGSVYGSHSVDSGYLQGELYSAATTTCEPFRIGMERGYADLFGLVLRTAKAGYDLGLPAIPVMAALPENRDWVELGPDLVDVDWDITVTIEAAPAGGELAKLQAISQKEQLGYITHEDAIRQAGSDSPQRVTQQRMVEQLATSPGMMQALEELVKQRLQLAAAQPQTGVLPQQPLLPAALAGALQPMGGPMAARLPGQQQFGVPGISNPPALPSPSPAGTMGAPNLLEQMGALPQPPTRPAGPNLPSLGGPGLPGAAQFAPGGVSRQDQLNALRR